MVMPEAVRWTSSKLAGPMISRPRIIPPKKVPTTKWKPTASEKLAKIITKSSVTAKSVSLPLRLLTITCRNLREAGMSPVE